MDEPSLDDESSLPAWTAFGDLMTVLLGAFMLLLVGVLASQLELSDQLQTERAQREAELLGGCLPARMKARCWYWQPAASCWLFAPAAAGAAASVYTQA